MVIDCCVSETGSNPNVTLITLTGMDLRRRNVTANPVYVVSSAVTREFNGRRYTCEASNGETVQQITYTVTVIEPGRCFYVIKINFIVIMYTPGHLSSASTPKSTPTSTGSGAEALPTRT